MVIVPKYRKKVLYGQVKKRLGEILRELARQKGVKIEEGFICVDHVHMLLSIPPKYSVAKIVGFIKGKSAIKLHNEFSRKHTVTQKSFWSRGYFVRTSGINKDNLKNYIQNQWEKDRRDEGSQLDFKW